ncbi:hypothetical protein NL364_27865, partial [Klebsiella pneumoniae]|nr:hypothetical protein [Klebsiella pneumoniae]
MMDSLASGSLGLMAIGNATPPANASSVPIAGLAPSPLHSMQLLVDALAFLNEQASTLRFGAHLYDAESNLSQMLIAFKGLVKALQQSHQMEF